MGSKCQNDIKKSLSQDTNELCYEDFRNSQRLFLNSTLISPTKTVNSDNEMTILASPGLNLAINQYAQSEMSSQDKKDHDINSQDKNENYSKRLEYVGMSQLNDTIESNIGNLVPLHISQPIIDEMSSQDKNDLKINSQDKIEKYLNPLEYVGMSQLSNTIESNIGDFDPLRISQPIIDEKQINSLQTTQDNSEDEKSNSRSLSIEYVPMSQQTFSQNFERIEKVDPLLMSQELFEQENNTNDNLSYPTSRIDIGSVTVLKKPEKEKSISAIGGKDIINKDNTTPEPSTFYEKQGQHSDQNINKDTNFQSAFVKAIESSKNEEFVDRCTDHLNNKEQDTENNYNENWASTSHDNRNCTINYVNSKEQMDTACCSKSSDDNSDDDLFFESQSASDKILSSNQNEPWWVRKSVDQTFDPDFEEFINTEPHYRVAVKATKSNKSVNKTEHLYKFSPMYLMIGDIFNIKTSEHKPSNANEIWYDIFGRTFYVVMLYGRIVETKKSHNCTLYTMDDGTGSIKVRFNHNSKSIKTNLKQLSNVDYELAKAKINGLPNMLEDSRKGETADKYIAKMEKLILLIRQKMNRTARELDSGTRAHVLGHPYYNEKFKSWTITAFNLEVDESNGPAELFWKKFMISIYEEIYYKEDLNKSTK